MKFYFVILTLFLPAILFAQYPDMYMQYRSVPDDNPDWKLALKCYGDEKNDSALFFAEIAEKEFIRMKDQEAYLFINNFKGRMLGEMRQAQKALEVLADAREHMIAPADTLICVEYSENLFLTGRIYSLLNDYKSCEVFFLRAAHVLEMSGRYPEALAIVYYNLMRFYQLLMKNQDAQYFYLKAVSTIREVKTAYARGIYCFIQADGMDKAQSALKADFYKAAVRFFESNNYVNDFNYYNSLLKLIAQYSAIQPRYESAMEYVRKAERYAEFNRISKSKIYRLYLAIGDMYRVFHQYDQALSYFSRANEITKEIFGEKSFEYMLSNIYIGRVYRFMDDYAGAAKYYYHCLDIGRKNWTGRFPHEFTLYGELAKLYAAAGQPDSALVYAHKRLCYDYKGKVPDINEIPPIPDTRNVLRYYRSLVLKIDAYRQSYMQTEDTTLLSLALKHCDRAMQVLETVNIKSVEEASGLKNSGRMDNLSSYAVYFLLQQYRQTHSDDCLYSAIGYTEDARANYLKFMVKDRYFSSPDSLTGQLKKDLSTLERQIGYQLSVPDADIHLVDSILILKSKLLERALTENTGSVDETEHVEIPVYNTDSIRRNIPQNSGIVIYKTINFKDEDDDDDFVPESRNGKLLLAFYLDGNSVDMKVSNLDESHLALMTDFRGALKTGDMSGFYQTGHELYEFLLGHFRPLLKDKKNLVVITDPSLPDIPFESLALSDEGNMLCTDLAVSYHYSLGLWNQSRMHTNGNIPGSFFAVAPDYGIEADDSLPEESGTYRDGARRELKPLPMAKDEVAEIGRYVRRHVRNVKIEKDGVSKMAFKKLIGKYDIVHVASHGFADMANYGNSGICFSRVKSDTVAGSNLLSQKEICTLRTDADLVVLSACKTSAGDKVRGEGTMALPRGFIYAGVPNVIASLWNVHDERTKGLMLSFYRHLLEDKTGYAEALRRAKLDCIAQGYLPVDWAGFVLIGN